MILGGIVTNESLYLRIAETYLADPRLSLKQVAQALGYSDGTVFWRAYRGWTGRAPSRAR